MEDDVFTLARDRGAVSAVRAFLLSLETFSPCADRERSYSTPNGLKRVS